MLRAAPFCLGGLWSELMDFHKRESWNSEWSCLRHKLWWTVTWLSDGWLVWELGSQELNDSETQGSWRGLRLSVAMFAVRIILRVSILRGIIIIVLLASVGFCRECFIPSNKGSRNCPPGDNTNNNRNPDHAWLVGSGGSFWSQFWAGGNADCAH